jgi:uncharacterized protein
MPDPGHGNVLGSEKSPYLLQHAGNPVHWLPWGSAAFEEARDRNVPILLSIGYATCHWCHVMAHESFEDQEIADFLNDHYVCIKVDREERPDVDSIYMDVCQSMTGRGGWPLTVIMDADQRPFFAGTYFPPRSRSNQIGFLDLAQRIAHAWDVDREKIDRSCQQIEKALVEGASASSPTTSSRSLPTITSAPMTMCTAASPHNQSSLHRITCYCCFASLIGRGTVPW